MVNSAFWINKKVFITGHTGFKGSWISIWLKMLGAEVSGYSLPASEESNYKQFDLQKLFKKSIYSDINDYASIKKAIQQCAPEIVIHMAAQPLVRHSYVNPIDTYKTNVLGLVHVLEACRETKNVQTVLNITTDKCYENNEWAWPYRETDVLGGYDPYSSSKACSELVTQAYRNSFMTSLNIGLATARAGNVIGGGDWASDRLIPDIVRSIKLNTKIVLRSPHSLRPWQHVLEPLSGYLLLCENLSKNKTDFSTAINFGPKDSDLKTVLELTQELISTWGNTQSPIEYENASLYEAKYLRLDCSKAKKLLNWSPKLDFTQSVDFTVSGYKDLQLKNFENQIEKYMALK